MKMLPKSFTENGRNLISVSSKPRTRRKATNRKELEEALPR